MPDGDNQNLPDLDYAFLTEYAKVEPQGTLSVIGASFSRIQIPTVPSTLNIFLAGRLRAAEGSQPVHIAIHVSGPTPSSPRLELETQFAIEGSEPYEGRIGILFSVGVAMPVTSHGVHEFAILVEGKHARSLKFHATP
jgi:hypothetical protein